MFNKERKETKLQTGKKPQEGKKFENKDDKGGKNFKKFHQPEVTDELDQHNRPMYKVSLCERYMNGLDFSEKFVHQN